MAVRQRGDTRFDFSGIERGLNRIESRDIRKEEQAREEKRSEEARQAREGQQGFQGIDVQQRQQGLDLQAQQLAFQMKQKEQEFIAKQEQEANDREQRESQAKISNALAVGNSLLKAPGVTDSTKRSILKTIAGEMDGVFDKVDLQTIDSGMALDAIGKVWKDFESGKLTDQQLLISMQTLAGQYEESSAAQSAAITAGTIFGESKKAERIGLSLDKGTTQIDNRIKSLSNRLNQINEETGEFFLQGDARKRVQERLEFFEDKLDESLGFVPKTRPAQASAPQSSVQPSPVDTPPDVPPPVELPDYLKGAGTSSIERNFYAKLIAANPPGTVLNEEEFRAALKEAQDNFKKKQEEMKKISEEQALTGGGTSKVVSPPIDELRKGAKGEQKALK